MTAQPYQRARRSRTRQVLGLMGAFALGLVTIPGVVLLVVAVGDRVVR